MKKASENIYPALLCAALVLAACMNDNPKPTDVLQQYDRKTNRDTLSTKPLIQTKDSISLDTSG